MKRHKILSWVLSLVMALTVFSIPVGSVYAGTEDGDEDDIQLCMTRYDESLDDLVPLNDEIAYSEIASEYGDALMSEEIILSRFIAGEDGDEDIYYSFWEAERVVWTNSNPAVAGIAYINQEDDVDEDNSTILSFDSTFTSSSIGNGGASPFVNVVPVSAGQVTLTAEAYDIDGAKIGEASVTVNISENDLPKYCLAISRYNDSTDSTDYIPISGQTIDYSQLKDDDAICVCREGEDGWQYCAEYEQKIVWNNSNPEAIVPRAYDEEEDDWVKVTDADFEDVSEIYVAPQKAGEATFNVNVYRGKTAETPLVATLQFTLTISDSDFDSYKYGKYLGWYGQMIWCADYDDCEIWGELPELESYNEDRDSGEPEITSEDLAKIQIVATVGGKEYTKVIFDTEYPNEFTIPFAKTTLGAAVVVTYTMGSYTKTEKTVVSRYVDPKVTVKNYTYDGKYHKPSVTVKVGATTLKNGTDYYLDASSYKAVGTHYFDVISKDNKKYRFWETKSFRINPKGTYVKTLKKAKKAFTVKWAKQATKMSTSRITGYQIQYSTSSKFTKKTTKLVTVKGYTVTSKKIKKLKKKKYYYVRVRTYKKVGKVTYYSPWSKAKKVKTK